jgi:CO dehydrogenase/acetyl-CoA synthase beta subunit
MAIFDVYVKKLAEYVGEMQRNGRRVREIDCPSAVSKLVEGLPVRVGPQASSGVILRGDTFVELGNPATGSCAFLLWTDNPSLIRDGKITLIGPDIQESPGASLPFAQVLMVGGADLGEGEHEALEQNQYIADQIEGYMIRSVSQLMWSRVSKDAGQRGFCFETLGRALMAIFKSEVPKVQAMEIVFVTSGKEDLQPLHDIGTQVGKIARDIVRKNWKAKGIDLLECTFGWDCGSCPDKPVCDDIKELITVRKKRASKIKAATEAQLDKHC